MSGTWFVERNVLDDTGRKVDGISVVQATDLPASEVLDVGAGTHEVETVT